MKKKLISVTATGLLVCCTLVLMAQKQISLSQGAMPWTTKSQQAKKLAAMGFYHIMNVEREQAYQQFKSAVDNDPNFTVPLAFLSNLSSGETKKLYAKRAMESAMNKSEGEKLFASLVDENTTPEQRRDIWSKLHVLHPNDRAIGHFFAITRATPEERFAEATAYNQKYPEEPAMYNMLGYYYLNDKKDPAKAKEHFEKYIQLYPDGANPYDSMGEFYMLTGDMANAEKYYGIALEKYPFTASAVEAMKKFEEAKKAKMQ